MLSKEFEHAIPAIKHLQTHILDLTAIGVGFPLLLKVKVKIKFTLELATKAQRGGERYSSTLSLTSALVGGGWSKPRLGRFTPGEETPYPLYRRLIGIKKIEELVRKSNNSLTISQKQIYTRLVPC
jgi:hypothetical protein